MKTFEIFSESKKKGQNGRRKFKLVLYKIHPDDCIDLQNEVGTQYNLNGITWIREYCERNLDSIKGMFLRCEFLDDERTEICGHGLTDIEDGVPIFENATTIGTFTNGYIDEIEDENGDKITVCIGEGEIDSSCYHNFCEKLDNELAQGFYPQGSVEIMRTEDEDGIIYKYGYKDKGRIPMKFIHSGFSLIGIKPSDSNAKLLELNSNNKEETTMTEAEINEKMEAVVLEKNEAVATSEAIQKALDECKAEFAALDEKYSTLCAEANALREELGKAKARERIGELNAAIASFSDTEKDYAKAEIEAFNADPVNVEINSVVSKIYEGIGKTAKADEDKKVAEQNAAKTQIDDIFAAVEISTPAVDEDVDIFA